VDLVGPYSLTAKRFQPDGSIQSKELQLTCMTMLDPVTGWFEIVEVPNYIIIDVNNKMDHQPLIDKSSAHVSHLFDQTCLVRYPRPKNVIFDNGSEFKKNFVPLLEGWSIKPTYTTIKNPQSNSPVERIHQVLWHMFVTKGLHKQILSDIDPFGSILSSVAWAIRASHNSATDSTPAQLVFGQDMMFNLKSLVNWKELSIKKNNTLCTRPIYVKIKHALTMIIRLKIKSMSSKTAFTANLMPQSWDHFVSQIFIQMVQYAYNATM
jgi:hypothetical protein